MPTILRFMKTVDRILPRPANPKEAEFRRGLNPADGSAKKNSAQAV
jgi:hypothetical protein